MWTRRESLEKLDNFPYEKLQLEFSDWDDWSSNMDKEHSFGLLGEILSKFPFFRKKLTAQLDLIPLTPDDDLEFLLVSEHDNRGGADKSGGADYVKKRRGKRIYKLGKSEPISTNEYRAEFKRLEKWTRDNKPKKPLKHER